MSHPDKPYRSEEISPPANHIPYAKKRCSPSASKEYEFQKLSARPIWSILGGVGGIGGVGGLAGTFLNLFLYANDIHWRKSELFRYF